MGLWPAICAPSDKGDDDAQALASSSRTPVASLHGALDVVRSRQAHKRPAGTFFRRARHRDASRRPIACRRGVAGAALLARQGCLAYLPTCQSAPFSA